MSRPTTGYTYVSDIINSMLELKTVLDISLCYIFSTDADAAAASKPSPRICTGMYDCIQIHITCTSVLITVHSFPVSVQTQSPQ